MSKAELDTSIIEYLRARGYHDVADAFDTSLRDEKGKKSVVDTEALRKALEPRLKESANLLNELTTMTSPANLQNLLLNLGSGLDDILSTDPSDRHEGFKELESWVEGSLDMYRPEFRPILFPIFCHFYLDLIQRGFKDAAIVFYNTFSSSLSTSHFAVLHHLSTLLLPAHVQNDEHAQRFRDEKYIIRMSRSGFGLLIGWLTEGVGGEATGAGEGFQGEKGKRGRAAVMRVVNNHLRFDVTSSNPTSVAPNTWEESTGLLSSLIPQTNVRTRPLSEELRAEAERTLREHAMLDRDPAAQQFDVQFTRPQVPPGVITPAESDLPPHPATFKTADVEREVSSVKDARKRIRLDPSVLANVDLGSPQANTLRARALPSVCAYTLHNVPEGAPCMTFSQDTSLMAAGFAESYIKLWSLKGEKLRECAAISSPVPLKIVTASLRKAKEKKGSTTRKLIGHSGPVYSVAFDPCSGSAAPPNIFFRSQMLHTAVNPVWDVKWSPLGIYFATASRDRTARLWSTDRTSCLRIYAGHLSDVDVLSPIPPNSLYLATGSSDWTARLWDVQRGSCVRVFIGQQGAVTSMAISPDGRYLATGGEDLAVNLWDIGSGKRIKKMTGHTGSIYSLAFSAESSLLVSGGADWTVRCWDIKSAGGLPTKPKENGVTTPYTPLGMANNEPVVKSSSDEESIETTDLVATFPTKRTPITNVQFTQRNLCLVGGNFLSPEIR
ncbi:WD40-repeat-containing domain protein [Mucidula mucida]|nr:WD40-repeat-containing domain protein [Mucidula mucida]